MSVERIDPDRIMAESPEAARRFIDSDYKIRSGLCPNNHGLMEPTDFGQRCPKCGFFCNTPAETGAPQ